MRSKKLGALALCLWLVFSATTDARADGTSVLLESSLGDPYPIPPSTLVGLAGWYGEGPRECLGCLTDQRGRYLMASGGVFDDSLPTIACGTAGSCSIIPLGTLVRITNLENGKTTIVRVTDTGGFGELGRIIDCSKAVAGRLEFLEEGLALVQIEIVVSAETPTPNLLP